MSTDFEYSALISWAQHNGRGHLPWRNLDGLDDIARGYRVWLSEILLQQTQADRVILFYTKILERFPDLQSLASTDYETFFPYYSGLWYYSRARNLLKCAQIVHDEHGSRFPEESEKLKSLPWIGPYTAEAIRAFAYGIPTLSFDTNLEKVFSRYYHGSRFIRLTKAEKTEILNQFIWTGLDARIINGALMDFAALHSKNQKSLVQFEQSPFRKCRFTSTRWELEIEPERKIRYFPIKDAKIEVILHESHRKYFSSTDDSYNPFHLPPTENNIREYVKEYFRKTHGLEVSVRPPHKKEYRDNIPYICMHAQVQTGSHEFQPYTRHGLLADSDWHSPAP